MNKALQYINLFGVLALVVLSVFQWRINQQLNLHANLLEKTTFAQTAKIEEHEKTIRGCQADLDSFREQLKSTSVLLHETEGKLADSERELHQASAERDQLKESITNWIEAVAVRDRELAKAQEQLDALANERNDAVVKFNELALEYNSAVTNLNVRADEYNALVEKYNELAKSASK